MPPGRSMRIPEKDFQHEAKSKGSRLSGALYVINQMDFEGCPNYNHRISSGLPKILVLGGIVIGFPLI